MKLSEIVAVIGLSLVFMALSSLPYLGQLPSWVFTFCLPVSTLALTLVLVVSSIKKDIVTFCFFLFFFLYYIGPILVDRAFGLYGLDLQFPKYLNISIYIFSVFFSYSCALYLVVFRSKVRIVREILDLNQHIRPSLNKGQTKSLFYVFVISVLVVSLQGDLSFSEGGFDVERIHAQAGSGLKIALVKIVGSYLFFVIVLRFKDDFFLHIVGCLLLSYAAFALTGHRSSIAVFVLPLMFVYYLRGIISFKVGLVFSLLLVFLFTVLGAYRASGEISLSVTKFLYIFFGALGDIKPYVIAIKHSFVEGPSMGGELLDTVIRFIPREFFPEKQLTFGVAGDLGGDEVFSRVPGLIGEGMFLFGPFGALVLVFVHTAFSTNLISLIRGSKTVFSKAFFIWLAPGVVFLNRGGLDAFFYNLIFIFFLLTFLSISVYIFSNRKLGESWLT